jgi:adenosylcobinamide-phosphate synthase
MVGYKNEKYINYGKVSARLDDIVNFIPSRISAIFMIISAFILKMDWKKSFLIWKRDRFNHSSPNSAQTESVCAGALNIMLAGDAYYFGKLHKKKTIGDNIKQIENEDIKKVNRLMYCSALLFTFFSILIRFAIINFLIQK